MQASSGLLQPTYSGNGHGGLLGAGGGNGNGGRNGNGNGGYSPSSQLRQGRLGAPQPTPGVATPPSRQPEAYGAARPRDAAFGLRGGDAGSPPDIVDHPILDSQDGSQTSFELARQNPLFQSGEAHYHM